MSPHYASAAQHEIVQAQIARDPLAADRTMLANERTFLAYLRTAITILVAALSLISFFPSELVKFIGFIALVPSLIIFGIGFRRYSYLRQHLQN